MPVPHRHTVTDLPDLIAVIPYLIGHHPDPDADLVVATVTRRRVTTIARGALPSPDDTADRLAQLGRLLPVGADELITVGYGPQAAVTPVLDAAIAAIPGRVRAARVTDGRIHDHTPGVEPSAASTPIDQASPAVVAAIVAGRTAAASRDALAARIAPAGGATRVAMTAATREALDDAAVEGPVAFGERVLTILHAQHTGGTPPEPGDDDIAAIALFGHTPGGTDTIFGLLDALIADTDLPAAIDLWTDITRRADPALAATPAAVLGYLAWRDGGGPLARIAVDRALAADPDHRLGRLVDRILDAGISPSAFDDTGTGPERPRP